jgi:hypothetical protein
LFNQYFIITGSNVTINGSNKIVTISRIAKEYSKMKTPTIEKDQKQFSLIKELVYSLCKRSEDFRKNFENKLSLVFFFNFPFWIDIDIVFWDLDGRKKF